MTASRKTGRGSYRVVLAFAFAQWGRQRLLAAAIFAVVLLRTLADLFTPYYAGQMIDALVMQEAGREAAHAAALAALAKVVGLGVLMIVAAHLSFIWITAFTLRIMRQVAAETFARVQRFSTDWHANTFAGSTVRRITRGMWAFDLLDDTLMTALFPSLAILAGATVMLGLRWPAMGLVVAAGSVVYVVLTVVLANRYVAPSASLSNVWDTRLGGAIADAISCNAVVKAFGAETREEARLERVLAKWDARTARSWVRGTNSGSLQFLALLIFRAAILGMGLQLWWAGVATPGDVAYVLTTYLVIHSYLRDVGQHIRNLQRSVNDMEELVAFHAEPLGVTDRAGATPIRIGAGRVVFEDVTFHYGGHATPLYERLSVEIAAGSTVGLVGHSGSGKTTFVKLIQRLYDVTGGRIVIDGQDIAGATQASLRAQIAIVQQEPILFHRTLAENIAYGRPGARQAEIEAAARQANAHDFIAALPKGYQTLVGERGVKLSGGERQRVALARAFLADAPILILDEATSSLDSESEAAVQEAMLRLAAGRTTIVIAHRLSTVRALDRILVFDRGRIVEDGPHGRLIRAEDGIYRRLFERQMGELELGRQEADAAE